MKTIRAILNGKKAGAPELRREIVSQRDNGISIEVRVTWESDDMLRLIKEAVSDGVQRIIVAGGDGTVNEAVAGLNVIESHIMPELAIIPMGTANDFATATLIPTTIKGSLELAINGESKLVDSVKANDRYFMNIAAAGFGAEITAETPVELKNFLGGGAYTLTGLAKALGFKPYNGSLTIEKGSYSGDVLVGAFCNGRLAGGGQPLAPNALIDDGLMDLTLIRPFPPYALPQVLEELKAFSETGEYIVHTRSNWLEIDFPQTLPLNLDGEPYKTNKVRFDVLHKSIKLVLPKLCPCLSISE